MVPRNPCTMPVADEKIKYVISIFSCLICPSSDMRTTLEGGGIHKQYTGTARKLTCPPPVFCNLLMTLVPLSWLAAETKAQSQNKSMQFYSTRQAWCWPWLLYGKVCPFSLETHHVLQTFAFKANSLCETEGLRVKLNQNFSPQL